MWYESIAYTSSYLTRSHRHAAWQLTGALDGEFRFRMDGQTVVLKPGDWILLSPEYLHDAGSDCDRSRAMQIFFRRFPPDLMPELACRYNMSRGLLRAGHAELETLRKIAADFLTFAGDDKPFGKSWRAVLGQQFVISTLSNLPDEDSFRKTFHPDILKALEYMEEHFTEQIGIVEFAEMTGLSESRFASVFHRETGTSPMRFFNSVRLGHAKTFLLNGLSLEEAAFRSGFSSVQYFCRYFKKNTGVTPGEFRRKPFQDGEE